MHPFIESTLKINFLKLWLITACCLALGFVSIANALDPHEFSRVYSLGKQDASPNSALIHDANGNHYGTSSRGGDNGFGSIYKIDNSGNYTSLYSFTGLNGRPSSTAQLILGNNGKLFGYTDRTNDNNFASNAVLYELNLSSKTPVFRVLQNDNTPEIQLTDLVKGLGNRLYGARSNGVIFRLDLNSDEPTYTEIYAYPEAIIGNLIENADGKLYGIAKIRSQTNQVFELNLAATTLVHHVLYEFSTSNLSKFIFGNNGKIYLPINLRERAEGTGIKIFQIDNTTQTPSNQLIFTDPQGSILGNLAQDKLGNFYLTKSNGVFKLNLSGPETVYSLVYTFASNSPVSDGLTMDSADKLYGYSLGDNESSFGVVFQIDPSSNTTIYNILHQYSAAESNSFEEGTPIVQGKDGKFYGVTSQGGRHGRGALFQLDTRGATPKFTELYHFGEVTDQNAMRPSTLFQAADGNFYGTTIGGGASDQGTLFRLTFRGAQPVYKVLMSFDQNMGYNPSSLIQANDGKLYGTMAFGGSNGHGTLFKIDLSTNQPLFTLLHTFEYNFGSSPLSLSQTRNGKLYGTTISGGSLGGGTLFEFDINRSLQPFKVLTEFPFSSDPIGGITLANDGNLYGTTSSGGNFNHGTIYKVNLNSVSTTAEVIYSFNYPDGSGPRSKLLQGKNGKFYGTTVSGGIAGHGTVFQFDPTAPTHMVIYDFKGNNGINYLYGTEPGQLIQGNDGQFYGNTKFGGQFGGASDSGGVIFRINQEAPIPVNTPPIAINDNYSLSSSKNRGPIEIKAPGILRNDKDAEENPLTVWNSSAKKPLSILLSDNGGKVEVYPNGKLVYMPKIKCFRGTRYFSYRATDGELSSNSATVALTIKPVKSCKSSD
jgi:uncharacterized repeat protein (TIGR03803 family)